MAKTLQEKIAAARGIVVAAGIYNYDVNSAAKNLLEPVFYSFAPEMTPIYRRVV